MCKCNGRTKWNLTCFQAQIKQSASTVAAASAVAAAAAAADGPNAPASKRRHRSKSEIAFKTMKQTKRTRTEGVKEARLPPSAVSSQVVVAPTPEETKAAQAKAKVYLFIFEENKKGAGGIPKN